MIRTELPTVQFYHQGRSIRISCDDGDLLIQGPDMKTKDGIYRTRLGRSLVSASWKSDDFTKIINELCTQSSYWLSQNTWLCNESSLVSMVNYNTKLPFNTRPKIVFRISDTVKFLSSKGEIIPHNLLFDNGFIFVPILRIPKIAAARPRLSLIIEIDTAVVTDCIGQKYERKNTHEYLNVKLRVLLGQHGSSFKRGWQFELDGQTDQALIEYKKGKKQKDKCSEFHWNCIDLYRKCNPCNLTAWNKFTLTEQEFNILNECYQKSNSVEVYHYLCILYYVMKKYEEAHKWLKLAVDHEHYPAYTTLAFLYESGYDPKQLYSGIDIKRVCRVLYYDAACAGNFHAQYTIGLSCFEDKDYDGAHKWWSLAATAGHFDAQNNLARLYQNGLGVKQDNIEAYKWYLLAAEAGDTTAQINIGNLCLDIGDYEGAHKWLMKVSDKVQVQYKLGLLYERGLGCPINYQKAHKWWWKAAQAGHSEAQYKLGELYEYGRGAQKNHCLAREWYSSAAQSGILAAQSKLGYYYYNNANYKEAYYWLRLAADRGDTIAQYNLGLLYLHGHVPNIEASYKLALKWLTLASEAKFEDANNAIIRLNELKNQINILLQVYIGLEKQEGLSYLFFSNFLAFLTDQLKIIHWNDSLLREWVTKYIIEYSLHLNPKFDPQTVGMWFDEFFG